LNAQAIGIQRETVAAATATRPPAPAQVPSELPEVRINGTAEGLVATRIQTPLRDIPQSLSIISAEQMRQQNNFEFGAALDDAVGITSVQRSSVAQTFFSRGFQITTYALDGGGALYPFAQPLRYQILLTPDLSEIDHIEVLRGSNALFGADSPPGG